MKSQSGSRTFTLNDAYDFILTVPPNSAWDTDTVYSDAIPCILRGESYTYIKSGVTYTTSLSSDGTQITIDMSSTGGTYITCYGKLE